jgi:hypothetical protein
LENNQEKNYKFKFFEFESLEYHFALRYSSSKERGLLPLQGAGECAFEFRALGGWVLLPL